MCWNTRHQPLSLKETLQVKKKKEGEKKTKCKQQATKSTEAKARQQVTKRKCVKLKLGRHQKDPGDM